jgi:hypothetical protein
MAPKTVPVPQHCFHDKYLASTVLAAGSRGGMCHAAVELPLYGKVLLFQRVRLLNTFSALHLRHLHALFQICQTGPDWAFQSHQGSCHEAVRTGSVLQSGLRNGFLYIRIQIRIRHLQKRIYIWILRLQKICKKNA